MTSERLTDPRVAELVTDKRDEVTKALAELIGLLCPQRDVRALRQIRTIIEEMHIKCGDMHKQGLDRNDAHRFASRVFPSGDQLAWLEDALY